MSIIEKAAAKTKVREELLKQENKIEIGLGSKRKQTSLIEKTEKIKNTKKDTQESNEKDLIINVDELTSNNILVMNQKNSMTSEEFRLIKRQLLLNAFTKRNKKHDDRGNIIMVTSSKPNEGKTFSAVSLALSIAKERDLTVMLIDADVAKPDVLKYMGANDGKGLIDIIEDKTMNIGDCLLRTNIPNLTILPAGKNHSLTTELLASSRMGDIIDELAERYHDRVIIIDSSPVLASSSAPVIALNVGQVVFVVEAEKTNESELTEALSLMSGCPNINLILNKARFPVGKKKFGSYYGYNF